MSTEPPQPPAGWFPDPEDPTQQRYWDGSAWTAHRAPAGPPQAAQAYAFVPPPTASAATTSLVLGILSLVCLGAITGIPAMIIGRRATKEIKASGGRLGGEGLATAGFVTGLIGTILMTFATLFVIGTFAFGGAVQDTFDETCTVIGVDPHDPGAPDECR